METSLRQPNHTRAGIALGVVDSFVVALALGGQFALVSSGSAVVHQRGSGAVSTECKQAAAAFFGSQRRGGRLREDFSHYRGSGRKDFLSPLQHFCSLRRESKMEVEMRQAELVEQFVVLAKTARGRAAAELITHATSHPSLFAFSELLGLPTVIELQGTEHSVSLDLLRLFAHGTWTDYQNNRHQLPPFHPQQELKLKQLTVMALAETAKVLPYDLLMEQLDISNVRELEDLLINDCMYAGIVRGKLDQRRRCFEVQFAAGRDLRPGQLDNMIQTLATWLGNTDGLLLAIQEKIRWADSMSDIDRKHKKDVEDKAEELRKSIKAEMDLRGQQDVGYTEGGALVMDYEEDRSRPKRRR